MRRSPSSSSRRAFAAGGGAVALAIGCLTAAWPAAAEHRVGAVSADDGGTAAAPARPPEVELTAVPVASDPIDAPRLELPDGSFVPALNGAIDPPPLARAWDPESAYAPILGRRFDGRGVEWYQHADGSQSTTRMVYRSDLGRWDAVTSVAHPGAGEPPPVVATERRD